MNASAGEIFKSEASRRLIRLAIEEDFRLGDVTTDLLIDPSMTGDGVFIAKEPLVAAGLDIVPVIIEEFGFPLKYAAEISEGAEAAQGAVLARISGAYREILIVERTALNFLQRISGVATNVRRAVEAAGKIKILDTRKTTPGYRAIEKYAVRVGGGVNHRLDLGSMVLVKNNHADAAGGMKRAVSILEKNRKRIAVPIEIEVRNAEELGYAIKFRPDFIMLDNMSDEEISSCLTELASIPDTKVEVSGGITPSRLSKLEKIGVEFVSMGSLTTAARAVDIALRIQSFGAGGK